jgi:glutathione S-transferase
MPIQLYDLAGADATRRFSPFCWRTHMALKHKGLDFDTIPWRFTDKEVIAFTNQGLVVNDSWRIAEYLEQKYPAAPALFPTEDAKKHARFIKHWAENIVHGPVSRMIILDIFNQIDPKDREYFRGTREKRFGKPLEAVQAERDSVRAEFLKALAPMRSTVKEQPFLSGDAPAYADYIVFGAFQWARVISDYEIVPADDAVAAWRDRMLGLFNGYAASYPAA